MKSETTFPTASVALLRGVNVGGKNRLSMREFKAALTRSGFESVRSYIQSGNLVYRSRQTPERDRVEIEGVLSRDFGIDSWVHVLSSEDLSQALAQDPFQDVQEGKLVHFCFLREPCKHPDLEVLQAQATQGEQFQLRGSVFYLYAPQGIGRSRFPPKAEKALGVPWTARNRRSVEKVLALASS